MQQITRKQNNRPLFLFRNENTPRIDLEFTAFILGRIRQLTNETEFAARLVRSHVDVPVIVPLVFRIIHSVLELFCDFSQLKLVKFSITLSNEFKESI